MSSRLFFFFYNRLLSCPLSLFSFFFFLICFSFVETSFTYIYIYTYIRAVIIIIIARSTGRIDNRTIVRPVVPFSTTTQSTQNSSLSPPHDSAWLDGLNSPLIQDEGDSKCLKLRFDVSQYTPEEIVVKTVDNKLLVSTFSFFPLLGIFLLLLVLKLLCEE